MQIYKIYFEYTLKIQHNFQRVKEYYIVVLEMDVLLFCKRVVSTITHIVRGRLNIYKKERNLVLQYNKNQSYYDSYCKLQYKTKQLYNREGGGIIDYAALLI